MTDHVIIKSYKNGISIQLSDQLPFSDILEECYNTFNSSAKFFDGASVALAIEGRELSQTEELMLLRSIQSACNIKIVCIAGKNAETEEILSRSLKQLDFERLDMDSGVERAQFVKGSLKKGDFYEAEESVIVIGDVDTNATIVSKKNVIVLGTLLGEVYAGTDGNRHFVAALDFCPKKLRIGDAADYKRPAFSRWGKRVSVGPLCAYQIGTHIETKELKFTEELQETLFG